MHTTLSNLWLPLALGLSVSLGPDLVAQPAPTAQWSVAVLDQILAALPPGQTLARVGDMQIRVANLRTWRDQLAGAPTKASAFDGTAPIWPGGDVYYTFDNSVAPDHQKAFLDGAAEWATFANLHFLARSTQSNYVTIQQSAGLEGGQSAVGMVGGQQFLSIGPSAWNRPTICHELGHTLGLVHEHQRSDRDNYVLVLTTNILSGEEGNFVLLADSRNQGAYDFLSVMHYSRNSLSIAPNLDTLEPQPAYAQFINLMGRQFDPVLSAADRAGMAAIYGPGPILGPVVTNTQDSGPGSLRAALYYAFDHPGTTISFDLSTADPGFSNRVFTIQPTDALPSLVHATVLDGSTEPTNSNPNGPAILLNGALAPPPSVFPNGLRLAGTNCVVRSLIINGFAGSGLLIDGPQATGNAVFGCFLGLDPTGTVPVTNGFSPLVIDNGASGNLVGGTNAAARNILSGSFYQGLVLRDPGTKNNLVQGNYIGLNATGTGALSNRWSGVAIFNGAQSNLIGGALPAARNVISGNGNQGLVIADPDTTGNLVEGNYIGVDPSGAYALPNGWAGISIFNEAAANQIGGPLPGLGNLISGNGNQGVTLSGTNTSGNLVQGNYIGTDPAGSAAIPNRWAGVSLWGGAQSNWVGGLVNGAGNVISGNGDQGVTLADPGTAANLVAGNLIGLNPAGSAALGNGWAGVNIFNGASGNWIGLPGAGNFIGGNGNQGVALSDPGTSGNIVAGNYIGLDATGSTALPNAWSGVAIFGQAQANLVGGNVPAAGNVISGNANQGIVLADTNTANNLIEGNFIGLDATGTYAVSNAWAGVDIFNGAQGNVIGGGVGARNVIAGNGLNGVAVSGFSAGNVVQGNTIGLNAFGSAPVPNHSSGVALFNGAQDNQIGGTALGAANLIAANASDGVQLFDATSARNTVRANSIFANGGAGLILYSSANQSQAAPVLTGAVVTTNTVVSGSLASLPSATFHLDFYANAPATGSAQAMTYLGAWDVVTAPGGTAGFSVALGATVPPGYILTATATDLAGNTSSLSAGVPVSATDTVGDGLPDGWRQAHFGGTGTATNGQSCAACDPDHDGMSNWQEFLAGTDPNNPASALRLAGLSRNGADVIVEFQSEPGVTYRLETRNAIGAGVWSVLADQILGTGAALQLTDPGVGLAPEAYYRLEVLP